MIHITKLIEGSRVGTKAIYAVVDPSNLDALPLAGTDNGDGTASLLLDAGISIDTTGLATSTNQGTAISTLSSIDSKLPSLVDGKIPVDISVSVDSVDIGNVDISELPPGNLGQRAKSLSLSTAPAIDITDGTYIGDIKFGESTPLDVSYSTGATDAKTIRVKLSTEDVTTLDTSLSSINTKMSEKVQLHTNIDFSSASAQTIISAPGTGYRIRLCQLLLMSGAELPVNSEVAVKSGSTIIKTVKGAAIALDFPEHCNLGTNEALVLQATTADRVIGGVDYYVEAV